MYNYLDKRYNNLSIKDAILTEYIMIRKLFLILVLFLSFSFNSISLSKNSIDEGSLSKINFKSLDQNVISHTVTMENISTTLNSGKSLNSIIFQLNFGDFLYIHISVSSIFNKNTGVNVYLHEPSGNDTLLKNNALILNEKFFVNPQKNNEGDYYIELANPISDLFDNPLLINAQIAKITNEFPSFVVNNPEYLGKNFNFNSWSSGNRDNDTLNYSVYYKSGWNKSYSSVFTTLVTQTTNPNYYIQSIIPELGNKQYLFRIYINESFMILDNFFQADNFYDVNVIIDNQSPIVLESPSNFTVNPSNFSITLMWSAIDTNPYIYEIYKNNSLEFSSLWINTTQNFYFINILTPGFYNFSIIIYDRANNSVILHSYIKVIPNSGIESGFNLFYPLAVFLTLILYRIRTKKGKN